MRRWLASLAALALLPAAAGAQTVADYATPEGSRQFQLCRAAVFYHLDDKTRGESALPVSLARTLRAQVEFIMQESIAGRPVRSLAEGEAVIRFTEGWFLGFTETLRTERERLIDPRQRDRILLDCVSHVWVSMTPFIGQLMAWREQAIGAPSPVPPPVALEAQERMLRELLRP
jgi:hypothetical protein